MCLCSKLDQLDNHLFTAVVAASHARTQTNDQHNEPRRSATFAVSRSARNARWIQLWHTAPGPVQRRPQRVLDRGVHVRLVLQQQPHTIQETATSGMMQRRPVACVLMIDWRSKLQQTSCLLDIAMIDRSMQRATELNQSLTLALSAAPSHSLSVQMCVNEGRKEGEDTALDRKRSISIDLLDSVGGSISRPAPRAPSLTPSLAHART